MAVDKKQKRKKKREEKIKAKRREAVREIRRGKAEEYEWRASEAYQSEDYEEALKWVLKALKIRPADEKLRSSALSLAIELNDETVILRLVGEIYREGRLAAIQDHLQLSRLAIRKKDYSLAADVLETLVADAASVKHRLEGRVSKSNLKEAHQLLLYARSMLDRPAALRPRPRSQTKKSVPAAAPREAPTGKAVPPATKSAGPSCDGAPAPVKLPDLEIDFQTDAQPVLEAVGSHRRSDPVELDLALKAYGLSFRTSYDQLISLPTTRDVRSLWYQEETARKVMKSFRGRAILADEVGLGKTIEAGLIMKEYVMRGLVRTALVLVPSSLVHQWCEELSGKFAMPFVSTADPLFRQDPDRFWNEPFILASIQTAKSKRHFEAVTRRPYDIVVVDEAHHLKNRRTLNWKLVNAVQKTFLLMLTATPVQNSLEELYNLVTLLRPGHLKTQKAFKEQFVTRGSLTDPRNREVLRQLLKEVMVRNTRSVTQLHLPARFALTARITPTRAEEAFYQAISGFVSEESADGSSKVSKLALKRLLEAAGSSHQAALRILERMSGRSDGDGRGNALNDLRRLGEEIRQSGKVQKVVELLRASKEQKIVFINYIATLEYVQKVLRDHRIPHAVYHGGMSAAQKQAAIEDFRTGRPVLLATGTGGEGHNLQFCHVMVNYDLPWNPMEIEQRIGRIHRIGQEKEVQVYNFCAAGSIEDRILEILDRKINMFELVVGEVDMILGRLQGEEEFSDLVYEIWVKHPDGAERQKAFDALAARLKRARSAYEKSKELDEKLFQEDFGV